jgi:hypothetical protein
MSNRNRLAAMLLAPVVGVCVVAGVARANVVIGDWENGNTDGWIDWNTGSPQPMVAPKFTWASDLGVTRGASSLHVTQSSWGQSLSVKLQDVGHKTDFFANKQLMIDVTVPGSTTTGYSEIYAFWINAPGWGFGQLGTATPVYQWGWNEAGPTQARTKTLVFDYSAMVDGDSSNNEIDPSADYVEFILAPNDDGAHPDFYFDNARLMTPGDVNSDGKIDRDDLALTDRGYARYTAGAIAAGAAQWEDGDFNGDHAVDSTDYLMMDTAFAKSGGGLSPDLLVERQAQFGTDYVQALVAAVPEPGAGALLLVGSAAPAGRRRGRHGGLARRR